MNGIDDETRRALVTYVIDAVGRELPIGKKAVQKYIHLVDDAAGVETGYDFSIYTYGPFSRTLASELDFLDSMRAISVKYDPTKGSFDIGPGENAQRVISAGIEYLSRNKQKIDTLLATLKGKSAYDLELYSTLVFLKSHVDDLKSDNDVVNKLLALKPKYSKDKVERTLTEAKALMEQ